MLDLSCDTVLFISKFVPNVMALSLIHLICTFYLLFQYDDKVINLPSQMTLPIIHHMPWLGHELTLCHDLVMSCSSGLGQPSIRGGLWSVWMAHWTAGLSLPKDKSQVVCLRIIMSHLIAQKPDRQYVYSNVSIAFEKTNKSIDVLLDPPFQLAGHSL